MFTLVFYLSHLYLMLEGHETKKNFTNSSTVVIIAQYLFETHRQPNYNPSKKMLQTLVLCSSFLSSDWIISLNLVAQWLLHLPSSAALPIPFSTPSLGSPTSGRTVWLSWHDYLRAPPWIKQTKRVGFLEKILSETALMTPHPAQEFLSHKMWTLNELEKKIKACQSLFIFSSSSICGDRAKVKAKTIKYSVLLIELKNVSAINKHYCKWEVKIVWSCSVYFYLNVKFRGKKGEKKVWKTVIEKFISFDTGQLSHRGPEE